MSASGQGEESFRPSSRRYHWAVGLVALDVGMLALSGANRAAGLWRLGAGAVPPGMRAEALAVVHFDQKMRPWIGVLFIAAGIAFLLWLHRVFANARALAPAAELDSPGGAVAGYFIPVANLLLPPGAFHKLRRELTGGEASVTLVAAWWGCYLVGSIGAYVARLLRPAHPKLGPLLIVGLLHDLLVGLAGAFLLALIVDVERRLRERACAKQLTT